MGKISICVTTYNRYIETISSFMQVYEDVDEIIISDDASTDDSFEKLTEYAKTRPKIKLFRNETNLGCYKNKKKAMELATGDWCILLDSDNIIDDIFISTLLRLPNWEDEIAYAPSFARPVFDFRAYEGEIINKTNIRHFIDLPMISTMFNAMNFFINKRKYLEVFDDSIEPVTSDSEYFALCWLKANYSYCVVPGLEYEHRIWDSSHFKIYNHLTPEGLHDSIQDQLRNL